MQVVVTGSVGFIGSHLVAELRRLGHDVVGIDRRWSGDRRDRRWDLTEPDIQPALSALMASADAGFHLAGRPGVREGGPDADRLRHRDNVVATRALFGATPLGVPVVATSSSSVHGGSAPGPPPRPSRESDPLRPVGGYARSKARMGRLCRERIEAGGRVSIVRPFTVAGEGHRPDVALARWIDAARSGLPIRLFGSPARSRDVTDVRHVVRGLIGAAEAGHVGPLNLGTGVSHRIVDLAGAVMRVVERMVTSSDRPLAALESS
jgi:nucleoside-diphosphate-sugar epimerase